MRKLFSIAVILLMLITAQSFANSNIQDEVNLTQTEFTQTEIQTDHAILDLSIDREFCFLASILDLPSAFQSTFKVEGKYTPLINPLDLQNNAEYLQDATGITGMSVDYDHWFEKSKRLNLNFVETVILYQT